MRSRNFTSTIPGNPFDGVAAGLTRDPLGACKSRYAVQKYGDDGFVRPLAIIRLMNDTSTSAAFAASSPAVGQARAPGSRDHFRPVLVWRNAAPRSVSHIHASKS